MAEIIARASEADPGLRAMRAHRATSRPVGPVRKFADPLLTADGKRRAHVALERLRTLWFNTGTLCNLACENCYIESTPRNDRLVYLTRPEARSYLDEIAALAMDVEEIGFTGGEPFMNPNLLGMLEDSLARDYSVLVLTNAMRPMMKCANALQRLRDRHASRLALRVSVDHFARVHHEEERGPRSWAPTIQGLHWLNDHGFNVRVAARLRWGDDEATMRAGFGALFEAEGIAVDAENPQSLVLFPEMEETADTPEITTECWQLLGVHPQDMMCASSRMVVKRKGAAQPDVVSCTLLPYQQAFSLGPRLAGALGDVALNHPHCSRFCVLGGGKCSG